MVLPYMPSIQGRKANQETQRNAKFLIDILVVVSQAVKHIFLTGFAAFLVDSERRDSSKRSKRNVMNSMLGSPRHLEPSVWC